MTQMLVSGYWTSAFSEDVFYYSVNLATYLLFLGVGSYLSKKVTQPSLAFLAGIVLVLASLSGSAIPILRFGIKGFGNLIIVPLALMALSGLLCGMIIPLALRIANDEKKVSLGLLFFIDYLAAILFTLIFTYVCLVPLGYSKTGLVLGIGSSLVVVMALLFNRECQKKLFGLAAISMILPLAAFYFAQVHIAPRMDRTGVAELILNEQSHYQKILMTEENKVSENGTPIKERLLFLDGFIQFSSETEENYHLCIADIPLLAASVEKIPVKTALVLGGGDGLAVRNLLKSHQIEKITLVELDPVMIRLSRENPILRGYNKDSLSHPKVEVIVADAFRWVMEQYRKPRNKYDLIVIDFPWPKNLTLARLFSAEFYRATFQLLSEKGFVTIQAGPSYLREDPSRTTLSKISASILNTVRSVGLKAFPYVSPEEREAFVMGTKNSSFDMEKFSQEVSIFGNGVLSVLCRYDSGWQMPEVKINTLNTLPVSRYMYDWNRANRDRLYFYRGNHLIFLPD
ncbi:MAG: spermidine synthase [Deltaproteobacteria bacterium]